MNSSVNNYDPIESIIFEKGLKIKGVHFYPEMDMMVIVLNNQKIVSKRISTSERLSNASIDDLNDYELIGSGVGIHWSSVDEDISLKGILQEELSHVGV